MKKINNHFPENFMFGAGMCPSQALNLGFIPTFISCFLVNYDLRSYLLLAVAFAVACVVWLPFFKVYETQVLKDENNGEGK